MEIAAQKGKNNKVKSFWIIVFLICYKIFVIVLSFNNASKI